MNKSLKKINDARQLVKKTKMKPAGYNEHSKYKYFTPEQIDNLVAEVCGEVSLMPVFQLERNVHGVYGTLELLDLESEDSFKFTMASDIAKMTASNAVQQLGGSMTYTKRYLKMNAFEINDNSLEFDSQKHEKGNPPFLSTHPKFAEVKKKIQSGALSITDLKTSYSVTKEVEDLLCSK